MVKKHPIPPTHIPQVMPYILKIGKKYYRRMQPIPYKYLNPITKKI